MGTEHTIAKVAFGLGFNVVRDSAKKSGYAPAEVDAAIGKQLYADLRLEAFATLLKLDLVTTLIVVGGVDPTSKNDQRPLHEADAIRKMLMYDYGIADERIVAIPSGRNTAGNVKVTAQYMEENELAGTDCVIVSSLYHGARVQEYLHACNLNMRFIPAEAAYLMVGILEGVSLKAKLLERLGGGLFAERSVEEMHGVADLILKRYTPHIDPDTQQALKHK